MKAAIGAGTLKRTDFTAYEGGIGYYYTYIDGTSATDDTIAFSADSGILRNRYYLLRITRFSPAFGRIAATDACHDESNGLGDEFR